MSDIARVVFTGSGAIVVQLLVIALGTWVSEAICSAIGKGQLSNLIRLGGILTALTLVINSLWQALSAAAKVMGLR